MKDIKYELGTERLHQLIGTGWIETKEQEWKEFSSGYDFEIGKSLVTSEADVEEALVKKDYLLATKLALHLGDDITGGIDYAFKKDEPMLLLGLSCIYYDHELYGQCHEWFENEHTRFLAWAVHDNAKYIFNFYLLEPNLRNEQQLTLDVYNELELSEGAEEPPFLAEFAIYRPLDWLYKSEYSRVLPFLGRSPEIINVTTSKCCEHTTCSVPLLVAWLLEEKYELADVLVNLGEDMNPIVEHMDMPMIEVAIEKFKYHKDDSLLSWYKKYLSPLGAGNDFLVRLLFDDSEQSVLNFLELKEVKEQLSDRAIYELGEFESHIQLELTTFLSKLAHWPNKVEHISHRQEHGLVSIFEDIRRMHSDLLPNSISDIKISLLTEQELIVYMYEYRNEVPSSRTLVNLFEHKAFDRMMHTCKFENCIPTPFQLQLAFFSLSENEIKEILGRAEWLYVPHSKHGVHV